jgi:hypothetical protein
LSGPSLFSKNDAPQEAGHDTDWTAGEESQTCMYGNFREVITRQHPFFPDDDKVVPSMYADQEIVDELYGYWSQHMKKR